MKESQVVSDLMIEFPPISKEDNPEVLASNVMLHFEQTGDIINYSSISETQSGAPLKVASKRKSRRKESDDEEEAETKFKKQKKAIKALKLITYEQALPAIQEEIVYLEPVEVLKETKHS